MNFISKERFQELLLGTGLNKKRRELIRYQPETISHWEDRDFLAVFDRTGNGGVMIYNEQMIPFSLAQRKANAAGRVEAIICDICATWRRGTASGVLNFKKSTTRAVSYLVCADLDCSLHIRGLTEASKLSKVQLREQITTEAKIERLHNRLGTILGDLA